MNALGFRQLAKNLSLLTAGEMLSKVFTFLAFAYLARVLGPSAFGHLEFTLALMVFLTLFVDFGSSPFGARELALHRERLPELLSNIGRQRIGFAALAYVGLLLAVGLLFPVEAELRRLMLVYGLSLFFVPGFVQWVFQGLDRMQWVALGSIVRQGVFVLAVVALVRGPQHLWRMGLVECLAVAAFAGYNLFILWTRIERVRPPRHTGNLVATFRESMPVGLSELTWAATWYMTTILVGVLLAGPHVGWFGAAHRPIMTLHTFVWLYFYNLLPSMSRCRERPIDQLRTLVGGSLRITAWVSIFGAVVGTMLAEPIIRIAFGAQYVPSVPVFRILVWVLPVGLISGHYRYALIAYRHQKQEFYGSATAAGVSVAIALSLVPRLGIVGAALAILASALTHLAVALAYTRARIGPLPFLREIVPPIAAGLLMVAGFALLRPLHPVAAVSVGCALYLATLLVSQPRVRALLG